jgi:hypothetical protein
MSGEAPLKTTHSIALNLDCFIAHLSDFSVISGVRLVLLRFYQKFAWLQGQNAIMQV